MSDLIGTAGALSVGAECVGGCQGGCQFPITMNYAPPPIPIICPPDQCNPGGCPVCPCTSGCVAGGGASAGPAAGP